jgi:hypothetical protein
VGKLPSKCLGRADLTRMISRKSGGYDIVGSRRLFDILLRTLADTDNRGKLNMAEFHVAMGLIYRRT